MDLSCIGRLCGSLDRDGSSSIPTPWTPYLESRILLRMAYRIEHWPGRVALFVLARYCHLLGRNLERYVQIWECGSCVPFGLDIDLPSLVVVVVVIIVVRWMQPLRLV